MTTIYNASPQWYANQRSVGRFWVTDPEFGPPNPPDIAVSVQTTLSAAKSAGGAYACIPRGLWQWKTPVTIDLFAILSRPMGLRCVPGTRIQLAMNVTSNACLEVDNTTNAQFLVKDFYFLGAGNNLADCSSVLIIGGLLLERSNFFGVTAGADFGVVLGGGGPAKVTDTGFYGCGCLPAAAPGGCLVLEQCTGKVTDCVFQDSDGLGGHLPSIGGASWITLFGGSINVEVDTSQFGQSQNASILVSNTGPFSGPLKTPPILKVKNSSFNTANPLVGTAAASIKGIGHVAMIYLENLDFGSSSDSRTHVNVEHCDYLVVDGVATNNTRAGVDPSVLQGDFRMVSGVGNGTWDLRNIQVRPGGGRGSTPILDFSAGAPSALTINTSGIAVAQPPSLPGLKFWLRSDLGSTAGVIAHVTSSGATYAAVTPLHHLDFLIDGYTVIATFTGAENSQGTFLTAINSVANLSLGLLASIAGVEILYQAVAPNSSLSGVSSGQILASTSADVLTSLGLTVGPFIPAVATAVTDESGLADATHNVTAPGGNGPTWTRSAPAFKNTSTWTFAAATAEALVSGAWSVPLPQPYTIALIARQTTAAVVVAFDGGALLQCAISGDAAETGIHLNAGNAVVFPTPDPTVPRCWICTFAGANSTVSISSDTNAAPQDAGANTLTAVTIGNLHGGASAGFEIADIIILDHAATLQDRRTINQYANAFHGITLLP
jgi:hypothetical protein